MVKNSQVSPQILNEKCDKEVKNSKSTSVKHCDALCLMQEEILTLAKVNNKITMLM